MDLKQKIRVIEDFPSEGISYKDISTLLIDKDAFQEMVKVLSDSIKDLDFEYIVGIEARGFIVGAALAYAMNKGFVMIRKPGKLPGETISQDYTLEYGKNTVEMHIDSFEEGAKVVIIDDLLATGGTIKASCNLVEKAGGKVQALVFLAELTDLNAREVLKDYEVRSIIKYDH